MSVYKIAPIVCIQACIFLLLSSNAFSAIVVDRTRVIVENNNVVTAVNIRNKNDTFPFLAQSWIEDEKGEKITKYFTVIPPIQRVEPNSKSIVRIQRLSDYLELPQDRETLFFFNIREIPPKSEKINVLQIALQSKLKMFYRPKSISQQDAVQPFKELKVSFKNKGIYLNNPTPYYLSMVTLAGDNKPLNDIDSVNIAPFSDISLPLKTGTTFNKLSIVFVDDYGGTPTVNFNCNRGVECYVIEK